MSEVTKEQVKDFLSSMSVIEMAGFVKELEEAWGVTAVAQAPVMAAAPTAAAPVAEAPAEPTEFTVVLTGFGANKLNVIKEVRAITGLGLKEAKELVDGAPKPVKEGVNKDEAAEVKKRIEAVGGTVEIKPVG